MTHIDKINGDVCDRIRHELNNAFRTIEAELGISIKIGRMRYDATNVRCKLEASVVSESGDVMTREAVNWALYAPQAGLGADWIGRDVETGGGRYHITGWNTRAGVYKVQATKYPDGRRIKMAPFMLRDAVLLDE